MYFRMVSWLTLPAVLAKKLRVHMEGNLRKCENSRRKKKEVTPLHTLTTWEALSDG